MTIKSLYELADSGYYWGRKLRFHLQENLRMEAAISDAVLYLMRVGQRLAGLCVPYKVDTLRTGSESYSRLARKTGKCQCMTREWDHLLFAEVQIEKVSNGFILHQEKLIEKPSTIKIHADLTSHKSTLAKLAWATQTRPDICCSAALLRQAAEEIQQSYMKFMWKGSEDLWTLTKK